MIKYIMQKAKPIESCHHKGVIAIIKATTRVEKSPTS